MKLKRICAWCGKCLGWRECELPPNSTGRITHGICKPCSEALIKQCDLEDQTNQEQNTKEGRL